MAANPKVSSTSAKKQPQRKAADLTEADIASEKMGKNSLQGRDQASVRNQRHAVPNVRREADTSIQDTLEKTDPDVRARRDLGKGKGVHPGADEAS
ncbi:MAG: hypothetical protein R3D67_12175 [Hyphomicrobiaceae bacterium]